MIGVTFWQWVAELALHIFATTILIVQGKNRALGHGVVVFVSGFSFVILPAFFLMADQQFRNDFDKKGLRRAIVNSLTGGPRITDILRNGKNNNHKEIVPIV